MEKLIEIIYKSLEESKVILVPKHWRAKTLVPRVEFKDLYPYEKQALGMLADNITKYYKNKDYI